MASNRSGFAPFSGSGDKAKLISRLKEAREYIGASQDRVAAYLDINRSAVSEIESGKRNLTAVELKKLASLYQKSVSWFTDDLVEDVPPDVEFLARTASGLSDNDRSELQRFAEFLKSKSQVSDGS
ncbi:helix-turn-helix transcriptional regulator [Pyruvatibacter sp.]|uniref:helix-turn-helix domain-containing protein n=1 Tax=Pyruvatibacter sp. TaxID=1981328 RepID=UPI0032665CAA